MPVVDGVHAVEILDSRSRPTLQVTLTLAGDVRGVAGVPSGASTGSREAVELRDGDPARYDGQGVRRAVDNVNGELADLLAGRDVPDQRTLDELLISADGTANKQRLGANAIVGVSMAFARAAATLARLPLWRALDAGVAPCLPWPSFNVINGGRHAPNPLDFQEFMLTPLGAPSMAEAVRAGAEVYTALRHRLTAAGHATGLGDEGGFAPELTNPEEVLTVLTTAIDDAGYRAGVQGVAIALDPAASEFRDDEGYRVAGRRLSSDDMIERYAEIVDRFPVVITMGCGDECPVLPGRGYEDWPIPDPAGAAPDEVDAIRADLDRRVRELVAGLLVDVPLPAPLTEP